MKTRTIAGAVVAGLVVALAGAAGAYLVLSRGGKKTLVLEFGDAEVKIPAVRSATPRIPKIIYLERHGATITGGDDASTDNRSSVVRHYGKDQIVMPAFKGSDARWKQIAACVRKQYAPFDVQVVEERPSQPGYVMAVFGGTPALLGADRRVAGLAPLSGEPIPDAVVLVFTRALGEDTRASCETAAMEIAHAYGLDHEYTCHDPMGYLGGCGARFFQDKDYRCGEQKPRDCLGGAPTQNSVRRLGAVLGYRVSAAETPPK